MKMSEAGLTKKALARSFKDIMRTKSFEKITIAEICEGCDLNRKSFYYHFRDKYDILNWIFDTELEREYEKQQMMSDVSDFRNLKILCRYLYDNVDFYKRAIKIQGQNSFSEHFTDRLKPVIRERLRDIMGDEMRDFQILFFSDAFLCAIGRWITDKDCMDPDDFVDMLAFCIGQIAEKVHESSDSGHNQTDV